MRRRTLALGSAAGCAALAGAAWRQWRSPDPTTADAPAADALWGLRFPRPEGGELVLAELRGRPLVLNFWATWCPPCVKEMPELDRFQRSFGGRGWHVVGLAVDTLGAVREFLERQPVSFAVGLAGLVGTDLSRQLGNARGALPFTAMFDREGRIIHRKLGETSFEELAERAAQA